MKGRILTLLEKIIGGSESAIKSGLIIGKVFLECLPSAVPKRHMPLCFFEECYQGKTTKSSLSIFLSTLKWAHKEDGDRLFSRACSNRKRADGFN